MILYNVTVKLMTSIEKDWLQWMREEHISEVLGTGLFNEARLWKMMDMEEEDGVTYAVQYTADSIEQYRTYVEVHAAAMRQKGIDKWGERFIAFRTLMERVVI
jgi:hypothetical protein